MKLARLCKLQKLRDCALSCALSTSGHKSKPLYPNNYAIEVVIITLSLLAIVRSVVEWLKRRARDQHGLGSKPTFAILLCPWERYFTVLSPVWWSWQAVLNYSHISIKLQADSNILASPEARRGNCLPYV